MNTTLTSSGSLVLRLFVFSLFGLMLASCDDSSDQSVDSRFKRAVESRDKGNLRASTIDLKAVLRKNPKNTDARLLLGEIYLDIGDANSAEKEIKAAKKLGASEADYMELLGKVWLLQGRFEEILSVFIYDENQSAARNFAALQLRGEVNLAKRRYNEAKRAFQRALNTYDKDINDERPHLKMTEPPESVDALIGLTRVAIGEKGWNEAEKFVARAAAFAPDSPELLGVQGEMLFKQRKYSESEISFQKAHDAKPYHLLYEIGLARAQMGVGKLDQAIAHLDSVLKFIPNHIATNYFRAIAAYLKRDFRASKEFAEKVQKLNKQHRPSYLILGASAYALGEFETAQIQLKQFLSTEPSHEWAGKLLGATLMRLGKPQAALSTLKPIVERVSEDLSLLRLIGTAAFQSGEHSTANSFFQQIVNIRPDDTNAQIRLGVTKFISGDNNLGVDILQRSIDQSPEKLRPRYTLMRLHFQTGDYSEALKVAKDLEKVDPRNPAPLIAAALAYLALNNENDAFESIEKALNLSPDHIGAAYVLAEIYRGRKEFQKVRGLYQKILEKSPNHLRTLLRLAELESSEGKSEAAAVLIKQAMESNPEAIEPRIIVAQTHLRHGAPLKSIAVLSEVSKTYPDDPRILQVLGQAQIDAGKAGTAVSTLERLVRINPKSAAAHYVLARAYGLLGSRSRMHEEFEIALTLDPKFIQAAKARVRGLILDGKHDAANTQMQALKSEYPDRVDIRALEGWVAVQQNRTSDAIPIFREVLAKIPDPDIMRQLTMALWNSGERDGAIDTIQDWLSGNPKDVAAMMDLGNYFTLLNRRNEAIEVWEKAIALKPNNWIALNNIADVVLETEPQRALTLAQRAYKLSPETPPVAITYAQALLVNNVNQDQALKIISGIARNFPKNYKASFLHAKSLAKVGKNTEAATILRSILSQNLPTGLNARASELLREVGG